jgi:hypothetical protein
MNAHTPAPWKVVSLDPGFQIRGGEADLPIAEVWITGAGTEANARLIAAAPDLADALQGLLHALESAVHGQIDIRAAEARAVLAKAGL